MPQKPSSLPERAFLLGVGGMGMAPLAIFMAQAGCEVSGHDDALQPGMRRLLLSHHIRLDTDQPSLESLDALVYSSAIPREHALLQQAREQGLSVLRRGEMLARLSHEFRFLAVAGSHGKTTTTGMLIHTLKQNGIVFNYILGARFRGDAMPPACYDARAEWLVAEVDESDGTIEGFSPEVTTLVNFDWDHADRYENPGALCRVFEGLASRTKGRVIAPESIRGIMGLPEERTTWVALPTGNFNQSNDMLAREAVAALGGCLPESALKTFPGIARRQDVLFEGEGVTVMADYAHHPAEIEALLALMHATRSGPLMVVFQPHRYSRTKAFAKEFARVLNAADRIWLLPVYSAGEALLEGGCTEAILEKGESKGTLVSPAELPSTLGEQLEKNGGVLLFVGAGDIEGMAMRFAADWALRSRLVQGLSADTRVILGEPLARRTTLRVGGAARFYAEPANRDDLSLLLKQAAREELPVFFLGRGSNLIVSDHGFDGLVISLGSPFWHQIEALDDGRLRAGAGVRLKELCGFAARRGMGGLEFLEGIPGTLGGALRMNAGAMGGWVFDLVESVEFVTMDGVYHHWPLSGFHVAYRECAELKHAVAVNAVLRADRVISTDDIRRRMDTYARKRKETQPREPSAGCIFKNPQGGHAGQLIDELGLKGYRQGGAEISQVHGNFMINRGGATSSDVLGLVRHVRETVLREKGILLEPEVLLVGEKWEEVLS